MHPAAIDRSYGALGRATGQNSPVEAPRLALANAMLRLVIIDCGCGDKEAETRELHGSAILSLWALSDHGGTTQEDDTRQQ